MNNLFNVAAATASLIASGPVFALDFFMPEKEHHIFNLETEEDVHLYPSIANTRISGSIKTDGTLYIHGRDDDSQLWLHPDVQLSDLNNEKAADLNTSGVRSFEVMTPINIPENIILWPQQSNARAQTMNDITRENGNISLSIGGADQGHFYVGNQTQIVSDFALVYLEQYKSNVYIAPDSLIQGYKRTTIRGGNVTITNPVIATTGHREINATQGGNLEFQNQAAVSGNTVVVIGFNARLMSDMSADNRIFVASDNVTTQGTQLTADYIDMVKYFSSVTPIAVNHYGGSVISNVVTCLKAA